MISNPIPAFIEMEREDHIPIEKYTLILRHEYVDKDGKTHKLSEPLMVSAMHYIESAQSVNRIIWQLTDKMAHEAMRIYGEES